MDGRRDDGQTDGQMDVQRETIIPHHYCVTGYKNLELYFILYFSGLNFAFNVDLS